jgi:3-oxoacyl-[acyl-carrier protein] reductase
MIWELSSAGVTAQAFQADVSCSGQADELIARVLSAFGRIDSLVCNAGIALRELFDKTTDEQWENLFRVNVSGAFYCCRAVLPHMLHRKKGRIVIVSSIWGITGASCEVAYSASKAALIGLTKGLAKEVGPSGITVNCVAPGIIDTDMNRDLDEDTRCALRAETPLGLLGRPEDAAEAIFFCASERAGFITGQVISPNGGYVI